ncbi:MAG: thioesterase family protein [Saprospiraceae bacterium]|jgi:acyl-CoA thioester hydrolase|nr:thioesterase family protein [Saprospiraceae bacterium]
MFCVPIQVQWLHLDPNSHVRHSAYFDFAAYARIALFDSMVLNRTSLKHHKLGPILFREEAIFKREILFGDHIECHVCLYKATPDFSRWGFSHDLIKSDGTLMATIFSDGGFINIDLRKLTALPTEFISKMDSVSKSDDFQWIEKSQSIKK